ncbi:MAG: AraC family transcriptional regulator, partial [Sphingobacteriaceae bacterium]
MINLALLYTRRCRPISVAAIIDVFESVNSFYTRQQKQPIFNI